MAIQNCFEVTQEAAKWDRLLGEAERLLPHYLEATRDLPHAKKGIRRSELFFFYALVAPSEPTRIIESGRARARFPQSMRSADASRKRLARAPSRLRPNG